MAAIIKTFIVAPTGFRMIACNCLFTLSLIHVVDIDECASSPCLHNAECLNKTSAYECKCVSGYTGINCETGMPSSINHFTFQFRDAVVALSFTYAIFKELYRSDSFQSVNNCCVMLNVSRRM